VRDTRLLRGGRGVEVAKDLDEIAFCPIWAVRECEYADEQRQKWDQREEDLVGDRTGEERTIVFREAQDDRSAARNGAG